jgi:type IV secretion system protein VirB4
LPADQKLQMVAMQLLSRLNGPPPIAKEETAGSRLPYAGHIDDNSVLLRDGTLMQVIRLGGLLFETSDSEELSYRKALRDAMLRAIGSPRFAIYHHIIRRRVNVAAPGEFPDRFSRGLDSAWSARLASRKLYHNELFVTIIRRPPQGRGSLTAKIAEKLGRGIGRAEAEARQSSELRALSAASDQMIAALGQYSPTLLGVYDTPDGLHSEIHEFLGLLYNAELQPMRLPEGDAGEYIPARRVSFGHDMFEMGPTCNSPLQYGAVLSIKDYPGATTPGMLDDLLRQPVEMVVSQSFAFVGRTESLSRMNLALRRMRAADDEALSLRSELGQAKDEVAASRSAFGEHHLSVLVRGATAEAVNRDCADVQAAMSDLGIISVREEIGLEPAFWAQYPGNFKYIARRAMVSTANFASLASCHNFPLGRAAGNHWGSSVSLFETTAAGPYHFNFHHGDLGNFTVIGPSGSGKTVMVNFLLAQARRFAPRIVFFDKDRGAELFIRAIGGTYDVLRPGTPSRLNPLRLEHTPENSRFIIDWIAQLAGGAASLSVAELAQIKEAVEANFLAPPEYRQLCNFVELLRGGHRPDARDLYSRLRPFWGEGEHAWLFDNADDAVDLSAATIGFDMTRLLDDPQLRTPAMMYLFHRVDERLDGEPTIIVIDEGWKALDDEIFVARIRDWEKTIRKRNGIIGFVTQNASDALASRIASTIVEQSATQIFAANPKASADDYMTGFNLSRHEFELIRSMPDNARCFLIKHGQDSVVVRLNLAGEQDLLTILSGRERTVRLFDEIRIRTGDDPEAWIPELLKVA